MKPKILLFDIENSPLVTWSWGIHDDPSHSTKFVKKDWYVMCWAAKWLHKREVFSSALPDYPEYDPENPCDRRVLKELAQLLNEADIVIAHNGNKFDRRKANARFLQNGITPPSPYRVIDTLTESRKHFMFTSNRLGDLGNCFGLGGKMDTGGFDLWKDCMEGNPKAWKKMVRYCAQDVVLLEKVYLKLRPYMKTHPNLSVFEGGLCCSNCGSEKLMKKGKQYTQSGVYQRYKCKDCDSACRGAKGEMSGETRPC